MDIGFSEGIDIDLCVFNKLLMPVYSWIVSRISNFVGFDGEIT